MRFTKGSKVEVLSQNEVPSGSWRCGHIIYGNGRYYTIRYEMDLGATDDVIVERVSRKTIRPCPPSVKLSQNWVPGDVVEVFHNFTWKMATVSKILGRNYVLVRLLGSSYEFKVREVDLRLRQSWQDDKWFVIGKGVSNCEDKAVNGPLSFTIKKLSSQVMRTDREMNFLVKDGRRTEETNANFQESRIASSRTLKRKCPNGYSQVGAPGRTAQKLRVTEKGGRHHRLRVAKPSPLPEKVDAIASHRDMLGETNKYTSFDRPTHFSEVPVEREKSSGAAGCSRAISLKPCDEENVTCSVASCSINSNDISKYPCSFSRGPVEDYEGDVSDAESIFRWGSEEGNCLLPTREEFAGEIRRLELHAYRCTMEALHALGPLSWEQETLVTNLRLSLRISNDEHLMELRNLISNASSMPIS